MIPMTNCRGRGGGYGYGWLKLHPAVCIHFDDQLVDKLATGQSTLLCTGYSQLLVWFDLIRLITDIDRVPFSDATKTSEKKNMHHNTKYVSDKHWLCNVNMVGTKEQHYSDSYTRFTHHYLYRMQSPNHRIAEHSWVQGRWAIDRVSQ